MIIVDFITEMFCEVDEAMEDVPHHNRQALTLIEPVTMGLLIGVKGVNGRYF